MKPQQIKNPHDHFFKESMERKRIAYALIQKFFGKEPSLQIDFSSLHIVKDIWIDTELLKHEADIVYVAKVINSSKLIYFLFEHKSFLDDQVFIQNHRYIVEIYEQLKKEKPKLKTYPVVIPCVLYHGEANWIFGNNINRSFEYIKGTEKYIPNYQTEIIDISKVSIDFKSREIELNAMLFALKSSRNGQISDKLSLLLDSFENCTDTQFDYLLVVLKYFLVTLPQKMQRKYLEIINTHSLGKKRNMKSIADSLIEEGVKKGKHIGLEKGEQIGAKKGERTGIKKGKRIGLEKGELIGVKKGERTGIKKGKRIGIEKGERAGVKKGSSETVLTISKRMVKDGFDDKTIRKLTHITIEQIHEMRKEMRYENNS
jgi:predicted transposase/invertase (TIGR01784 family)